MKSAVTAFLSVLVAIGLGLVLVAALDPGRASGRDPWPLLAATAMCLVVGGFVYRRWFHASALACAAGLAAYGALVGTAVATFGGTGDAGFFAEWLIGVLAATLVPWFAGFLAARFVRRPDR